MSRTWRTERKTPKEQPLKAPTRPRMGDFAREYYQSKGYQVESTVTDPEGMACFEAQGYLEADA